MAHCTARPDPPSGLKSTARLYHFGVFRNFGKINVLVDRAGYEEPSNDALRTTRNRGRVIVMAVHPDSQFSIDFHTLYLNSITTKGLKPNIGVRSE